jgi:hypothetical protein
MELLAVSAWLALAGAMGVAACIWITPEQRAQLTRMAASS